MTYETALWATEILLSLALIQRAAEHLSRDRAVFGAQLLCALALLTGTEQGVVLSILWGLSLWQISRFEGPYNGGADKMVMLVLTCLLVAHLIPAWGQMALGYLAVQLLLSYVISGTVKLLEADWRSGQALADVFALSIYPSSQDLRGLASRRGLLWGGSWAVMLFEVGVPLALVSPVATALALAAAALFHVANAVAFGLNRFVWAWLAAFPALLWFQNALHGSEMAGV